MARKTIRQRLIKLKRQFPHRTKYGFLYRHKRDVSTRFTTIWVYALIFDVERGHSIFIWNPHRKEMNWNSTEWNRWLNKEGLSILAHDVMEAINSKRGSEWEMQRMIGFHGEHYKPIGHVVGERKTALYPKEKNAVHKRKNKSKLIRRNKADDKR